MRQGGGVVILRALGLGDLLTGVPALRGLRAAFPRERLALATPPELAPLALRCAPIDEVLPARGLDRPLRWSGPALAVNLHGSGPRSHRLLLATRPRHLLAFRHVEIAESAAMPDWREDEHEVSRWCRLLTESGVAADPGDLWLDPDRFPPIAVSPGTTLIHPGAAAGARRWPAARWSQVARAESAAGRPVVITGGPGERTLAEEVARGAGLAASAVHCPRDVLELAGTVAAAARVFCADTGVAHLATGLRRPSVILFGPTPPAWWGPPPSPLHLVLWKGRRGDALADAPDPGLLAIGVGDVLDAAASLPPADSPLP